ncbi:MAG: serine hydrolase [Bacteroidota bacterium]
MRSLLLLLFFISSLPLISQELYFPPINGDDWETIDPETLNWCDDKIDELYNFLENQNTRAFLILKDGKIVLEKYFNGHGPDSLWYWASAGKAVTATLTGIAQEEGLLDINDKTSDYLGTGWTMAPAEKEELITIWHQLTMTSGLDDGMGDSDCTDPECLFYLQDAGTRWAYHNAPYTNISRVVEAASGQSYNVFYWNRLANKTGMGGLWLNLGYNRILFSKARAMARFGLLMQNDGSWDGVPVLADLDYINAMRNTSQDLNKSYGYLWWLNGKESFQLPGLQFEFPGALSPDAPSDIYSAIGKNGQFLSVVPSQNMVLVRMGEAPDNALVPIIFYNEMWEYINDLTCLPNSSNEIVENKIRVFPNPVNEVLFLELPEQNIQFEAIIFNSLGQKELTVKNQKNIHVGDLKNGLHFIEIKWGEQILQSSFLVEK